VSIYICAAVRDHVDLHCSVLPTSRCDWHANSCYYPEVRVPAECTRLRCIYECWQLQHYSHAPQWLGKGKFYFIFINNYLFPYILVIDCDSLCMRRHFTKDTELLKDRWENFRNPSYRQLPLFKNIHSARIKKIKYTEIQFKQKLNSLCMYSNRILKKYVK
jgi:hypothetical protein